MDEKTKRESFELSDEIMRAILEQHPHLDGETFAIAFTRLLDIYAKIFIPEEEHSEYFDDMADNCRTLAKVTRQDSSH